jgi:CheY-like chemotaxis protein
MAGCPRNARRRPSGAACAALFVVAAATAARAQPPVAAPLDEMQRAVVESLAAAPRETPAEFLDAAIRAADVDALEVAREWFARCAAAVDATGDHKLDVLADLGDEIDPASLHRLGRLLAPGDPAAAKAVAAIGDAARLRRRDPKRLAAAVAALESPSAATRLAAADELVRARTDALPFLVPRLQADDTPAVARDRIRDILAMLGDEAREPLLEWLASDDVASWPGVIDALDASGASDIEAYLLAPATVADSPPAARSAARRVLARRAAARGTSPELPSRDTAERILAARLDKLLCLAGLPTVDPVLLDPIRDPATAPAAFGGSVSGLVERLAWNPEARRFERVRLEPRAARAREAMHLARDLAAINTRDPSALNLVLLSRLEALLVTSGDWAGLAPKDLQRPLSGPDGFSAETAADVLSAAIERGMGEAAAGVAAALAPPRGSSAEAPLAPAVRKALVRALAVPDAELQFAAARTLALAAGDPPYSGSSRVFEILAHAATAIGVDRVVVAHPDTEVVDGLATDVSRFGYEPVRVSTGREAIFAAREQADTVLVLLAARLATPSALETTQLLQQQGIGDAPAVLVVVDPLDDDGRGCFLSQLLMKFRGLHGVGIVDRLDSFFEPAMDEATGTVVAPPRFPDALARAAGPQVVDPASREQARLERLARSREALTLLATLSRRGWDIRPATTTALAALGTAELYESAVALLGTLGRPEAQEALAAETERADLPAELRNAALAAFAASVDRYGVLLGCGHVRAVATRYNLAAGPSCDAAGDILEVLDTAHRARRGPRPDAPYTRPTR